MNRLHPDTLEGLHAAVQLPAYDRSSVRPGILHLGLGAFHRAHQAVFTEQAMAASGGDWGIIGVCMRSDRVAQQLKPQGNLYSVMSEAADGYALRVIGAISDVLVAPQELDRVVEAIASSAISIVTLTVTEKAYCLAADGKSLDRSDPVVSADLAEPSQPSSTVGMLALGLKRRLEDGGAPLTLISCDNLSANGAKLESILQDYLQSVFPEVLSWFKKSLAFPSSMVDRIVPAMTGEKKQQQSDRLGLLDEGAVSTEPFMQWIIEDNFAADRPDWDSAGVLVVADILPYETIKLRLLNATHSAIAYVGLLAGLETVDQVMADIGLRKFIEGLMAEDLMPALEVPANFELEDYRDALLVRFSNPCLGHRCQQIAMDGSEKIRQRWLPTLQDNSHPEKLLKALSAWCHFILCTDIPIEDPRGRQLRELRTGAEAIDKRLDAVLACLRIVPDTLADYFGVHKQIMQNLDILEEQGVRQLLN
jgi:fructuronate reductase